MASEKINRFEIGKRLPITYVENPYTAATDIARIIPIRVGQFVVIRFNLGFSASMPSGTSEVHIGTILYDVAPMTDFFYTLAPQNGGALRASLLVQMKPTGEILVSNNDSAGNICGGFYRTTIFSPVGSFA